MHSRGSRPGGHLWGLLLCLLKGPVFFWGMGCCDQQIKRERGLKATGQESPVPAGEALEGLLIPGQAQ